MFAAMRRRALAKLDDAHHLVLSRGPEGEQVHYDEKGKRVSSKARTEFRGYERYMKELQYDAGILDPEVERLAEDLRKSDAFWGEMPAIDDAAETTSQ